MLAVRIVTTMQLLDSKGYYFAVVFIFLGMNSVQTC